MEGVPEAFGRHVVGWRVWVTRWTTTRRDNSLARVIIARGRQAVRRGDATMHRHIVIRGISVRERVVVFKEVVIRIPFGGVGWILE